MALQVFEAQETRSAANSNGRATATRKFRVFDDATPIEYPSTIKAAFGAGSLPDVGDLFPDSTTLYAIGYSIRHVPDSRGLWEVEYSYENTEPGQYQPQEVGYVEVSIEYAAQFRELWRANPGLVIPTDGTVVSQDAAGGTCGGTRIDSGGVALSVLVRSSTITIAETVDSNTLPTRSLSIRALRGTRNGAQFQGAPKGQVLYLGASASRIAIDKYSIVHKFAQDEHYHLVQSAKRGPDGQVLLYESTPGLLQAASVNWRQPFPAFGDFNSLSENF